MPGARSRVKPLSAGDSSGSSASDEVSQLELHLQRQLEEDVASDVYTECNIQHQEKEIIDYLNENLNLVKNVIVKNSPKNKQEEKVDPDVYSTPNCVSPEEKSFQKVLSSSPSTDLTKEYYALVPIDENILDKELIEQDALSNAFQSINKSQTDDINEIQNKQCVKPTSLFLSSSHIPKINKHSNSCDILRDSDLKSTDLINKVNDFDAKIVSNKISQRKSIKKSDIDKSVDILYKNSNLSETTVEKVLDPTYSPDSLITDEPSSSSDYLSAAYAVSPAASTSGISQLNVGDSATKMENIITISDSGLETIGMLESLNSHKEVTLTDMSLTESTFQDMINDDANCLESASNTLDKNHIQKLIRSTSLHSPSSSTSTEKDLHERRSNKLSLTEMSGTSTKEEKQRQNEEIVILESSSLSSETGSWESVFPPKLPERDLCEKFITSERQSVLETDIRSKSPESAYIHTDTHNELCPSLVQKSPFKSTSCFIDAASLADEGDDVITVNTERNESQATGTSDNALPEASRPVPCAFKRDLSPNDLSESNDNEDSLEQAENKDPDSIHKDMSPTIFEMKPIIEDSMCAKTFENAAKAVQRDPKPAIDSCTDTKNPGLQYPKFFPVDMSTPNNSIIYVGIPGFKVYKSEEIESVVTVTGSETNSHHLNRFEEISNTVPRGVFVEEYNRLKNNNDLPIVSGGVSVEDHLPQLGSSHSGSPSTNRKKENLPIVSGAYIPEVEEEPEKPPKAPSNASAWVVDMSSSPKSDVSECSVKQNKKVLDKTFTILRSASKSTNSVENCKSRSSVDSDSSEKSTHKFYIDLSTLPDALAPDLKHEGDDSNEKKNIFSMFIDLGDKSATVKEMPARLSSSFNNTRKTVKTETKCTNSKGTKTPKVSCLTSVVNHAEDNIMFEKLESLCDDPNLSILDIISNPGSHTDDINELSSSLKDNEVLSKAIEGEPTQDDSFDLFVKLSDLDKPKIDMTYDVKKESIERMTRSIPDNDWRESNQTINSRSIDIISSFHSENALSLNRLFPHLKNDFSRSMPGSLLSRTMSPLRIGVSSSPQILDIDEHASDISEMSSVQSSYCRSVVENSTTEETSQTSSLISNCQSRLGQDLLRMFLEEIAPDVIVEVSGRRIKAHKCILSSRCQYFAGILSGGWVESAGNVIALPPFSFSVVHFALCHIYSGVSMIPDSISIVELATIADMLGLEGLKEAIMFTLKAKYCHHFHKPCAVCTAGVLECFTLSSVYGLDDLYRKCLRWITKHFHKVWPTKAFATLPTELLEKCYQEHIVNLTTENIVETVYGCGITEASLQNSRWSETVARMCQRLVNAAAHFAAPRLTAVLRAAAQTPAAPPAPPPPAMQALDDCMAAAIEWAPPDEACRAYAFLSVLVREIRVQHSEKPDLIYTGGVLGSPAGSWRLQCEDALVRAAPRVVGTHAFKELPPELRKRLRELGCIMFGAQAAAPAAAGAGAGASPQTARKTRSAGAGRRPAACARSLDFDQVRASFVPYAPKPQPPAGATELAHPLARPAKTFPPRVRSLDVNQVRASFVPYAAKPQPPAGATELPPLLQQLARPAKTFPPRVRTTKAQEERTKYNLIKTAQSQRTKYNVIKTAHSQKQPSSKTAPAVRAAYEHAKPRHLEPRPLKDERKPLKKPQPKMVSSSESSRNLSPVQAHGAGGARGGRTGAHVSRDSLAPASRPRTADTSTNSLSESHNSNKYATYTKARHTHKGSIESVTTRPPAKCHSITTAITKVKTKIPVYLNQGSKLCTPVSANSRDAQRSMQEKSVASNLSLTMPRNKPSGSLMNATKSSQAKMVLKQVKETQNKNSSKHDKPCKDKNASRSPPPNEIPVMKRSGTFSKEEPMFGEKATDIDFNK